MRLIDADALPVSKEHIVDEAGFGASFYVVHKSDIDNAPTVDAVEVRHGEWVEHDESKDDFYHHRCSICKVDAPFDYVQTEDYDEDMDGELYYMGLRIDDIVEHITNYCPNCGAKMDGERNVSE